jgi:hypothetical protein
VERRFENRAIIVREKSGQGQAKSLLEIAESHPSPGFAPVARPFSRRFNLY